MVSCHQCHYWSSVRCVDWTLVTGESAYVQVSDVGGRNEIVDDDISLFAENKDLHNNQKLKVVEDILRKLECTLAELG